MTHRHRWPVLVLLPLALGAALPGEAAAAGSRGRGSVAGVVQAAPTCPVQRAESPCGPVPVPGARVVLLRRGHVVGAARTDRAGEFRLRAWSGAGVVRAARPGARYTSSDCRRVTVRDGRTVRVVLTIDTGIR